MSRSPLRAERLARRYVAWVKRWAIAIVAGYLLLAGVAIYLIANHLPLYADFSYLLPQDVPAVRDLRRLEARVKAGDTVLAIVEAPDAERRAAAAGALLAGLKTIGPELVEYVEGDDAPVRDFLRARRHLFVPLADLERARGALENRIRQAKLEANPLYISLEDPDPAAEARDRRELEQLRAKRREAEARLARPGNVSADGRVEVIQIRTSFRSTAAGRGKELLARLDAFRTQVRAEHPDVRIGFAGGIVMAVAEHRAILNGMVLSSVITGLLVAVVLALYFRSATLLGLLLATLAVATVVSFGIAALTIGHLNAATAFLGAIIAGNGVNYGILFIARYLEESRDRGRDVEGAMAVAIVGTLRPTAIASLGASIAYGSLAVTSFRGFADFAVIGAIGMAVCWTASYVMLPALMLRAGRDTRIFTGDPVVGRTLVALLGTRRSGAVCAVAIAVAAVSGVIVARYIAADPFEYDIKQLRSKGADAAEALGWMELSDQHFGRGITGRTYIAADRPEEVPKIVAALRALDAGVAPERQTIGAVSSILDVMPEQQPEKLAVLADLRALLDDDALAALDDKERAEILELRPPDALAPITPAQLPPTIRARLAESNGRIGLLIAIRPAPQLDEWNGKDLIRFANAVRRLELPGGETVTTSGSSVIFADIVESIERDGPLVTLVAAIGLVVMVLLLVGPNRRAVAVLLSTGLGTLLMVATCAMIDLKINFLDFIALPITLGLGIDYAVNIAHRHDHDETPDPLATLRTSGAAVFVCSLTTIIGYGSLLASDNLAIRGFGTASLIGEVACMFTALVLVPAIMATGRRRGAGM